MPKDQLTSRLTIGNPYPKWHFVGRSGERRQLRTAWQAAKNGHGSLVLVAGEAGIGKTALCEDLAKYAVARGGQAFFGHCYQDGALSIPYLPFVEALRGYILQRDAEDLRKELRTGAPHVARILPELRQKLQVGRLPLAAPAEDRWRFLQAITDFLKAIAADLPVLLVLEDLHWADHGSLSLLLQLARNVATTNMLIVGTYRDLEIDRSHPLSPSFAELHRATGQAPILLRGLAVSDVHRLYEMISSAAVTHSQAEDIHRQTEGNPLFVREVLRWLVNDRCEKERASGAFTSNEEVAETLPKGLRDLIGRRFVSLSRQAEQLLVAAAVIGRDSHLEILRKVVDLPEENLIGAIEEAVRAGIIEEHVQNSYVGYRFSHDLFRRTLYEELSAPSRIRMHVRVGEALESVHSRHLDEHAAELAEHFGRSSDAAAITKAIAYGEIAARASLAVFAADEAANTLQRCLDQLSFLDSHDEATEFDLLMSLGEALSAIGAGRRILDDVAPAALAIAKALADSERCCRVCWLAMTAISLVGAGPAYGTPEAASWAKLADAYARVGTAERVRADIGLALTGLNGYGEMARSKAKEAYRGALELGDPQALASAESCVLLIAAYFPDTELPALALEIAKKMAAVTQIPFSTGDRDRERVYLFGADAYLKAGLKKDFEALLVNFEADVARRRSTTGHIIAGNLRGLHLIAEGHLEEAAVLHQELMSYASERGFTAFAEAIVDKGLGRAAYYLGQLRPEFRVPSSSGRTITADTYQGDGTEALRFLDEAMAGLAQEEGWEFWNYTFTGELAVKMRNKEAALQVLDSLRDLPVKFSGVFWPVCVPRLRGQCAALVGLDIEARSCFDEALRVCDAFLPELALAHLDYAELLLLRFPGERKACDQHLSTAIDQLTEMKMRPALERALRLRDSLTSNQEPKQTASLHDLTPREIDVLVLVAEGLSNQQIADKLVLSVRTVERHLTNSYRKIGAHSKAQATAYVLSKSLTKHVPGQSRDKTT